MTALTLDTVKAEQQRLADMVAALEAKSRVQTFVLPAAEIPLQPGEHYAGTILGKEGETNYHLILMADSAESLTWAQAMDWAGAFAALPTRREQALIHSNLGEHFKFEWYWSAQQHEAYEDHIWCKNFGNGNQSYFKLGRKLHARAVRRIAFYPSISFKVTQ